MNDAKTVPKTISSHQRKEANRAIRQFTERFHCRISGVLLLVARQVDKGDLANYVLEVLLERLEAQANRKNGLSLTEMAELATFKATHKQ